MSDTLSERRRKQIYIDSKLDELPLTMEAFRVYCHLARRAGRDGQAFPSYKSIAQSCFKGSFPNSSIDSLRQKAIAAVKELISWNLIEKREDCRADGSQSTNHYELTDLSEWLEEPIEPSTLARKPGTFRGNRYTKKPEGGSPELPTPVVTNYHPSSHQLPPLVVTNYPVVATDYSNEGNPYKGIQIEGYPIEVPLSPPAGESIESVPSVEIAEEEVSSSPLQEKGSELTLLTPQPDLGLDKPSGQRVATKAKNKELISQELQYFLEAYRAEKPSNFVDHRDLSQKHIKAINKLAKEYGTRSLEIFVGALRWVREQKNDWWRKESFSLDNLMSNSKLTEYADKHFFAMETDKAYCDRIEGRALSYDKARSNGFSIINKNGEQVTGASAECAEAVANDAILQFFLEAKI
jgi:hypothetical protein